MTGLTSTGRRERKRHETGLRKARDSNYARRQKSKKENMIVVNATIAGVLLVTSFLLLVITLI